ncbi:glycosyltransferase family 39 protein [candidate division WWE3 bacterium]|uniref:Glycosyltransferase family 39 protein n=1 Tax=candidate division WWE3 bacterium TaxID=2053526 RepID=A0A955EBH6_UNCKA|nr:glycosyltransferase family 39 protein [candidate division WWE3 bacterium]
MKKLINWIKQNKFAVTIFLTSCATRIPFLTRGELWYDEAFLGVLLKQTNDIFIKNILIEPYPALFTLLTRIFTQLVGVNDITLRILPLVFGILTPLLGYKLLQTLLKTNESAFISAMFFVINPFLIGYSVEARAYSLFGLLAVWATYAVFADKKVQKYIAIFLLLLSHYFAIFYTAVLLLYIYKTSKNKWWDFVVALQIILPTSILYIIATLGIPLKIFAQSYSWISSAGIFNLTNSLRIYFYGSKVKDLGTPPPLDYRFIPTNYLTILLVSLLVGVLYYLHKKGQFYSLKEKTLFYLYAVAPVFVVVIELLTGGSYYLDRYMLPSAIFFIAAFTITLNKLEDKKVLLLVLVIYATTLLNLKAPAYYTGMKNLSHKYKYTQNIFVFSNNIDYMTARYYFDESAQIYVYEPYTTKHIESVEFYVAHYTPLRYAEIEDTSKVFYVNPIDLVEQTKDAKYQQVDTVGWYKLYKKISE